MNRIVTRRLVLATIVSAVSVGAAANLAEAATPCGAEGQRACTIVERIPSCNTDLVEIAPCTLGAEACGFSLGMCRHPACGRENDRACTPVERLFNPCDAGFTEIPGCSGDCGGSSGTCISTKPCGGKGQRACTFLESGFAGGCEAGLIEVPGCSGDCFSSVDSGGMASSSSCTVIEDINEPVIAGTPSASGPTCSMYGYADMHLHLFADLGHGGSVLGGKTYDPEGGINDALKQDFTSDLELEKFSFITQQPEEIGPPIFCPSYLSDADCQKDFFHGDHDILNDGAGAGTKDGAKSNLGAPVFNGWPKWTSTTHQQAYYKWLERAWRGGLRLVTMLAVTNEALCRNAKRIKGTLCTDSMDSIDQQIAAAKNFEAFIAQHHGGWFKIAYTPQEAREAMAAGKLAVVLGIETAELFNCKFPIDQCQQPTEGILASCSFSEVTNSRPPETLCTPGSIRADVQAYYDMGVRHIFPVHNFDNAFGATAMSQKVIEIGNRAVEDHWFQVRECGSEGYGFGANGFLDALSQFWLGFFGLGQAVAVPVRNMEATCNSLGLLPLGEVVLDELMKKGMIIDVDHMSNRAFDATLAKAQNPGLPGVPTPYPVVASHVQSFALHEQEIRHERMRTPAQLAKIKNVGGMIAAMLKDDVQDTEAKGQKFNIPYGAVTDDCRHSSKTFAQAYQYAVDVMDNPVALGSDFNGNAAHFGPRFGSEACGGQPEFTIDDPFPAQVPERQRERSAQYRAKNPLAYPFTLSGFGTFDRQKTGQKTFDYNFDGLAHIGLLPDFVADLKVVGLPETYLNSLFRSAEGYVATWERARGETPATSLTCAQVAGFDVFPQPAYNQTPLLFSPTGLGVPDMAVGWDFGDGQTANGFIVGHTYAGHGTYSVTVSVTDPVSGASAQHSHNIQVLNANDAALGPRIAIGAPAETFEGDSVLVNFSYAAVPYVLVNAVCGSNGIRESLTQTSLVGDDFRAIFEMRCRYPGGADRTAQIGVTVRIPFFNPISLTRPIQVRNRPPDVSVGGDTAIPYNTTLVRTFTLSDAANEPLTLTVDWGDGSVQDFPTVPGPLQIGHLYTTPTRVGAPRRVQVTVRDEVASSPSKTFFVGVEGAPPTAILTGPQRSSVGKLEEYVVSSFDPDGGVVQLGQVSCGPSGVLESGPLAGAGIWDFYCRFSSQNTFNEVSAVTVDDEGSNTTGTRSVTVGRPPDAHIDSLSGVAEGAISRFFVQGYPTDDDNVTLSSISCDTGSLVSQGADSRSDDFNLDVQFECRFPKGPATVTVSATVHDVDGDKVQTKMVTVANVAPSFVSLEVPGSPEPGQNTGVVIRATDPGPDQLRVTINWGDGNSSSFDILVTGGVNGGVVQGSALHTWQTPGPYTVTVTLSDDDGGEVSDTRNVIVKDATPPTIAPHAEVVAEATEPNGAAVSYVAPATQDLVDPPGIATCSPVSGALFPLASSKVTCQATDKAGNAAVETSFNVIVQDTTPPSIQAHAEVVAEATGFNGAEVSYAAPATQDLVDLEGVATCSPASNAIFPLGLSTVTCRASDAAGNLAGETSFNVIVRDTTPPTIAPHAEVVAEATGFNGAAVSYAAPATQDLVDPEGVATCSPAAGAPFPLGPSTVTCRASDKAGNAAVATFFKVVVRDTTPPSIQALAATPGSLWPPNHQMVEVSVTPTVADLVDQSVSCQIVGISSSEPIEGLGDGDAAPDWQMSGGLTASLRAERDGRGSGRVYTLAVTCSDDAGNTARGSATVAVPKNGRD